VSDTPVGTFSSVAAGYTHSVAIRTDGTLASWGANDFDVVSDTPVGTYSAVAAGGNHSVALRPDGTLVSWGDDNYGQVSRTPTGTFSAVAAGGNHNVAIARSAAEQINDLITLIRSMSIQTGLKLALNAELRLALAAIHANRHDAACARVQGFIRLVTGASGKKLTPAQAAQLLGRATGIRVALGC
jgi:alpha-tubulin suppressor-like RCC1 family protein